MVRRRTVSVRQVNRRRTLSGGRRPRGGGFLGWLAGLFTPPDVEVEPKVAGEIGAIFYGTLAVLTILSLTGTLGIFGNWWAQLLHVLLGIGAAAAPVLLLAVAAVLLFSSEVRFNFTRVLGIVFLVTTSLGIVHTSAPLESMLELETVQQYGGYVGFVAAVPRLFLGDLGVKIVLFALFLVGILLTFGVSFRELVARFRHAEAAREVVGELVGSTAETAVLPAGRRSRMQLDTPPPEVVAAVTGEPVAAPVAAVPVPAREDFKINRPASIKLAGDFQPQTSQIAEEDWVPPSLDLLDEADESQTVSEADLRQQAEVIRQKLVSFGIEVTMHDVNIGPAVMQYTLKPDEGVKLAKIRNLKHDLALALAAKSLRIQAPIPGKSLVGIEIPNEKRITVRLKELLQSDAFAGLDSNLRLVLGRDVAGHPYIADLAQMPHLLVAGQTGSGKSVGINTFLLSLIYQNSPNDLRLILVDPKRVELVPYNGIPHLLTPVINDPDKTVAALKWAVAEMTRRYKACAKLRVRNLAEYNEKVAAGETGEDDEKMPHIVIVIDELADLMMVAGKEVEACICRLAQMARAVGMHLIIATQRPSVDVITGLIKANVPTRLAFRVAQGVDSKTILDGVGAEDLLGRGDMLFIPPGQSEAVRIQCPYVSTDEVKRVTNAIKLDLPEGEEPQYQDEITDVEKAAEVVIPGLPESGPAADDDSDEAVVLRAARAVLEIGRASTSLLQRRCNLGYARAARIVDLLEERGFIGPADPTNPAKPRAIYITPERLAEIEGRSGSDRAARDRDDFLNNLEDARG